MRVGGQDLSASPVGTPAAASCVGVQVLVPGLGRTLTSVFPATNVTTVVHPVAVGATQAEPASTCQYGDHRSR
ncbi:MAG: hypothetical protein QOJ62_284, partial [Actinomycetota bacterium]|nr:hypothetical protein [Actinomycetota bacterium]